MLKDSLFFRLLYFLKGNINFIYEKTKQSVDFMLHFAFLLVLLCFSSASSNDVGLWLIGKF